MIYSIIKNGLIINRVVADDTWVNQDSETTSILETTQEYSIGGTLINGVYTPPVEPVIEIPPVTVVSPRQARLALMKAGLLDQVEAAVTQAGTEAKIYWDYSLEIHRDAPLIASIGQSMGLTDSQLDDLFTQAATL